MELPEEEVELPEDAVVRPWEDRMVILVEEEDSYGSRVMRVVWH